MCAGLYKCLTDFHPRSRSPYQPRQGGRPKLTHRPTTVRSVLYRRKARRARAGLANSITDDFHWRSCCPYKSREGCQPEHTSCRAIFSAA